ncbi:MAG: hypothetical protein KDD66_01480 [Bdellovibrionales bacterium]|nr:hypothetical protein [Bdellovibrionales bacterium]
MTIGFEGPEKKFELLLSPGGPSLRARGQAYWASVVGAASATILSQVSNDYLDAYLLSESSLFVYERRVVMITCGCTTLAAALEMILKDLDSQEIQSLIFERKNENFPHAQVTKFENDFERIKALVPCTFVEFGNPNGDCIKLFHLNKPHDADSDDNTLELLMHDISPDAERGFDDLFENALIDRHIFEPQGYSLNALISESYYTVHVTPESNGSYASFETNFDLAAPGGLHAFKRVLEKCQPGRFDLLLFQYDEAVTHELISCLSTDYKLSKADSRTLGCGYSTTYIHGERK